MKAIICLVLCSTVAAAQDYAGSGVLGRGIFRFGEAFGQPQFGGECNTTWNAVLNVDKSQNVTFKELTFGCEKRIDFNGHIGNVWADIAISADIPPGTLDLNPIPVGNTFRIIPFNVKQVEIVGNYFNRGFEAAFEGTYRNDYRYNTWDLALDYTNFPDSLDIVSLADATWRYERAEGNIEFEPHLKLTEVYAGTWGPTTPSQPRRFTMKPVPPEEITDPLGDSNHDGRFDSGDLVQVFQAGEYEDSIVANSTWEEGDWNLDDEFDSGDLVAAFTAGTYADAPAAVAAVPEPSGLVAVVLGLLAIVSKIRRG